MAIRLIDMSPAAERPTRCRLCDGLRFVVDPVGDNDPRPAYDYEHPGLYRYQCPLCNPVETKKAHPPQRVSFR